MRSQRRFPNKADLLFCSSLQGCNSLLGFLHPSIPVFILPFSSSFSKLLSSRAKCANAIRRHLPCRFCASINLPDRVGCCCCCPGKVSSLGTCFHLKLTKKKNNRILSKMYYIKIITVWLLHMHENKSTQQTCIALIIYTDLYSR